MNLLQVLLQLPTALTGLVSDANACSSDTTSFDVTFVSGTGILSLNNLFNIYPNPTNDIINIDTKGNSQYLSANVYDIFGKLLINTSNNKIGLNKFEDGVYILEIKTLKIHTPLELLNINDF